MNIAHKISIIFSILFLNIVLVSAVMAQSSSTYISDNDEQRQSTPRATRDTPDFAATATAANLAGTAEAGREDVSATATAGYATREANINNFSATAEAYAAQLPQSVEELKAIIYGYLPQEMNLDDLDLSESSPEAASAVASFSYTHLGTNVNPVYARKLNSDVLYNIPPELIAQLPQETQDILASVASSDFQGATYYAYLDNGFGIVYTAENCAGEGCQVTVDDLQVNIEEASLGAYSLYINATANSATEAYNLLLSVYPELMYYTLEPVATEAGYAYTAIDTTLNATKAYFVGVETLPSGQSLVYATVGVGEGFVELGLWGDMVQ